MANIENYSDATFERIKHINEYGQEFWYARELARVLEYKDFRNFEQIIFKAMDSCKNSGNDITDHCRLQENKRKSRNKTVSPVLSIQSRIRTTRVIL